MRRFLCAFSIASVCSLVGGAIPAPAQDSSSAPAAATKDQEELKLADGKVIVTKPASWKSVKPKSTIIQYEFQSPIDAKETARTTIMTATGGIDANIKRWVGQFEGLKESDAKIEKKEIDKTTAHIVELQGTYKESMGGPFAPGGGTKKFENHAMLATILELADGTLVFIKMTGPKDVVDGEKKGFMAMIEGLKNK